MTNREKNPVMSLCRLVRIVPSTRRYASHSTSSPPSSFNTVGPYQVFDRNVKRMQRNRAARQNGGEQSRLVDYVRDEVAERMMERFLVRWIDLLNVSGILPSCFQDIKRTFSSVVDLGSGPGHFTRLLESEKVKKSIMIDSSSRSHNLHSDIDQPSSRCNFASRPG